jgi:hypothetical protein
VWDSPGSCSGRSSRRPRVPTHPPGFPGFPAPASVRSRRGLHRGLFLTNPTRAKPESLFVILSASARLGPAGDSTDERPRAALSLRSSGSRRIAMRRGGRPTTARDHDQPVAGCLAIQPNDSRRIN